MIAVKEDRISCSQLPEAILNALTPVEACSMTNDESSGLEVFELRSRVLRAIYYDAAKKKMVAETTQGKIRIYRNVEKEIVLLLVNDAAPGLLYEQHLKAALKPQLCGMTMSNIVLSRRVRRLSKLRVEQSSALSAL